MRQHISKATKKMVTARAGNRCEYCRVPVYLSAYDFHIEHIIGVQHGGPSSSNNLAYCCSVCNWKKGANIATILSFGGDLIPLFNPRTQHWFEHFQVNNGELIALSFSAEATIKLLELNLPMKIEERYEIMLSGFYP
jgi:HNH endonuclease